MNNCSTSLSGESLLKSTAEIESTIETKERESENTRRGSVEPKLRNTELRCEACCLKRVWKESLRMIVPSIINLESTSVSPSSCLPALTDCISTDTA